MRYLLATALSACLGSAAWSQEVPQPANSLPATPLDPPIPAVEPSATPPSNVDDAALLQEIQASLKSPDTAAAGAPGAARPLTSLGPSNVYNPAMSVNGLFLGAVTSNRHPAEGDVDTGLTAQEIELQVMANVDPYFAANIILSLPSGESLGIEEAFVTPSEQPLGIQARIGKIKLPFGRENPTHTHALPFVDKSLIGTAVFGEEGLGEVGAELSYLFPTPWYALLSAAVVNADNPIEFASPRQGSLGGVANLKNVFDLWDDATLEAGLSFATGDNANNRLANVGGAHLVFKWRPAREASTRELVIAAEAMYAQRPNGVVPPPGTRDTSIGGAYGYVQWRLAQRWYTAGRFDYLGYPNESQGINRRGSLILVFVPTEFSAIRLQADAVRPPHQTRLIYEGFVQLNFTLGAHPAHAY